MAQKLWQIKTEYCSGDDKQVFTRHYNITAPDIAKASHWAEEKIDWYAEEVVSITKVTDIAGHQA